MAKKEIVVTPEMKALLRATQSTDMVVAHNARMQLAAALTMPLKQGVMPGDTISGLFAEEALERGGAPEYPLDCASPGS